MGQPVPVRVRPSANCSYITPAQGFPFRVESGYIYANIRLKMLAHYFPVLVFIAVGILIGIVPIALGWILGPHRPNAAKRSPYECGFEAFDDARMPFDVRYYLVAILFIIFDLETAFLFPWAVVFRKIGWTGFSAMMIFLGILVVGFLYEWKRGALEWE